MSKIRLSAITALRSSVVVTIAILVVAGLRIGLERLSGGRSNINWYRVFAAGSALGLVSFTCIFILMYIQLDASEPAEAILNDISPEGQRRGELPSGFVAMEYYALMIESDFPRVHRT